MDCILISTKIFFNLKLISLIKNRLILNPLSAKLSKTFKGYNMNEKDKLLFFIQKLQTIALEKVESEEKSALVAIKESLNYIEGQFKGY